MADSEVPDLDPAAALDGSEEFHIVQGGNSVKSTTGALATLIGAGADGKSVLSGTSVPNSGDGNDGDFYIRTTTLYIYGPKASGTWPAGTSLVGPQGAAGAAGHGWTSGSGAPSGGTNGDYYVRTSNWDVYLRTSGTWNVIGNIQGATGATVAMTASSSTSATIQNGSVTLTFDTTMPLLGWIVGSRLRVNSRSTSAYMDGRVTALTTTDVTLTINATSTDSAPVYDDWDIALTGITGSGTVVRRSSSTSNVIGIGTLTFDYAEAQALGWAIGTRLRATHDAANYVEGIVSAYSDTSIDLDTDVAVGSGTYTSWVLLTCGVPGTTPVLKVASTTSNAIANTGSKTFGYSSTPGLAWEIGTRVRAAHDGSNYMEGLVSSVSDTSVTLAMDYSVGSGTFTSWNLVIAGEPGAGYTGSDGLNADVTRASTTSNAIANSGSKTFAYPTSSNLGWIVGSRLRFAYDSSNYMEGVVTAVSGTSVTATMDFSVGSGTYTAWNITLAGEKGSDGTSGSAGSTPTFSETSSTSNSLAASGSKTFAYTSDPNLAWVVGQRIQAQNDSTHFMEGVITSVSATSVTITADYAVGSGTFTSWNLFITGSKGADGSAGSNGSNGSNGVTPTLIETSTTSNAIASSGSKTFTYTSDPNLAWVIGNSIRAIHDSSNFMEGVITAVSATSVTFTAEKSLGSGTYTTWTLALTGKAGTDGAAGSNGSNGTNGTSFPAFSYSTKTANYTAVTGDFSGNKLIEMNVASANTFTVNSGLTGTEPLAITQMGAGQTTIVAGSGVTILSSQGLKLRAADSCATLIPCGTNRYRLSGDTTA